MGMSEGPGIQAGEVRSVDDDEADRLVAADLAVDDDGQTPVSDAAAPAPSEPFAGYDEAHADDVIGKVEDGALDLGQLLALRTAEAAGKNRSTVLAAVTEKLQAASTALKPTPEVEVPAGVVPGETPGWPVDAVSGEPLDLPDQVREELAAIPIKEDDVEETRGGSTADGATADSAKAAKAETTSSKKAGAAHTKASKKATGATKRS
jgi:hypothetical protein